jgi:hypothetical protein
MRRVRTTIVREKAIRVTYSECVFVALVIQHAMGMRRAVICGLPGTIIFFSTFSHKRQDFRKKKFIERKMCVLSLSTISCTTIFHSKDN